jgi:hypothetical protein
MSGTVVLAFGPVYPIALDGTDPISELIRPDPFTFLIGDEQVESHRVEAIILSPNVVNALRSDPQRTTWDIPTNVSTVDSFRAFLGFTRAREPLRIPREQVVSFLSIASYLGNEKLAFQLLHAMISPDPAKPHSTHAALVNDIASYLFLASLNQLRCLDRPMLHHLLASKSLAVENEDWLLRMLVDLDVSRPEFFQYIEVKYLTPAGLELFLHELPREQITPEIWEKIVARLRISCALPCPRDRFPRVIESSIIPAIPMIMQEFYRRESRLLYRASRDGRQSYAFHQRCDNRSNTLTLIQTKDGEIFGGFTPLAWDSGNQHKDDPSGKTFLFALKTSDGSAEQRFPLQTSAIYCAGSMGPAFGDDKRGRASGYIYVDAEGIVRRSLPPSNFYGQTPVQNLSATEIEVF